MQFKAQKRGARQIHFIVARCELTKSWQEMSSSLSASAVARARAIISHTIVVVIVAHEGDPPNLHTHTARSFASFVRPFVQPAARSLASKWLMIDEHSPFGFVAAAAAANPKSSALVEIERRL